jgi:hypothetical protein
LLVRGELTCHAVLLQRPVRGDQRRADPTGDHHLLPRVPVEFLYALIFTSTTAAKTIPVAIAEFTGRYTTDFGLQAAGGILAAIPPVLIAVIFQRYIVGGLASGAVKG